MPNGISNRVWQIVHGLDEDRFDFAQNTQCACKRLAVSRYNARFASGINFGKQQYISRGQHLDKIHEQVAGARITMRLKCEHQTPAGKCPARSSNGRGHFHWMMAVVIYEREAD